MLGVGGGGGGQPVSLYGIAPTPGSRCLSVYYMFVCLRIATSPRGPPLPAERGSHTVMAITYFISVTIPGSDVRSARYFVACRAVILIELKTASPIVYLSSDVGLSSDSLCWKQPKQGSSETSTNIPGVCVFKRYIPRPYTHTHLCTGILSLYT